MNNFYIWNLLITYMVLKSDYNYCKLYLNVIFQVVQGRTLLIFNITIYHVFKLWVFCSLNRTL